MGVPISENIAEVFHPTFNTVVRHEILAGGRASTKTSRNALKVIMRMLQYPGEEWIVVRQHYAHHADSTYLELQTALERLGLKEGEHFFTRGTKLKITLFDPKGPSIRFGGMDDFRKLKGFTKTGEGRYIGGLWFFEIDEFKGSYGIHQTVSTFVRGNKPHFTALYEYNPPERGSWVYDWVEEMKQRQDTLYIFANYNDLTRWEQQNWLGEIMLEEIEETKRINFSLYENIYLGKPRVLDGACYPRAVPDMPDGDIALDYINVGIDYGDKDATTAVAVGISKDRFYVLDHYYSKSPNKLITEKEEEIRDWLNHLRMKYEVGLDVYCETNPQSLYIMLKQDHNLFDNIYIRKVNKAKEFIKSSSAIQERIDAVNILIGKEKIFINPELQQIKDAMAEARYDRNSKRVDDGSTDIDSLDAMEYAIKSEIKFILNNYYKE